MAITITASELHQALGGDPGKITLDEATTLLSVVTELVTHYAPDAPNPVSDEAAIRVAGYLAEYDGVPVTKETVGPLERTWDRNKISPLRHSGAMALLSPWKTRRAGVILP